MKSGGWSTLSDLGVNEIGTSQRRLFDLFRRCWSLQQHTISALIRFRKGSIAEIPHFFNKCSDVSLSSLKQPHDKLEECHQKDLM